MRMGQGTDESSRRLQQAFDELWGYTAELFQMDQLEQQLAARDIAVDRTSLQDSWHSRVATTVQAAGISLPDADWQVVGGRQGVHTEHLGHMLSEMQFMQRAYPGLNW